MASSTETHEPEDESGTLPDDSAVFVDSSGRRRSLLRGLGWIVAVSCLSFSATLVVVIAGGSSAAPWLPIAIGEEKVKQAERAPEPVLSASVESPEAAAPYAPPAEQDVDLSSGATPNGGIRADDAAVLAVESPTPEPKPAREREGSTSSTPTPGRSPQAKPETPSPEPTTPPATATPVEPNEEASPTESLTPSVEPEDGTASPTPDPTADATPTDGLIDGVLASASDLLVLS